MILVELGKESDYLILTTYFSKINKVPEDYTKLIITRFPPKWFDISKYPNTYLVKSLAPSQKLLLEYKKNNNWCWYVENFYNEMDQKTLKKLSNVLHEGKKVCLICYEKDYEHCHRSLIGQYFQEEGIEWEEL